jgi:hypothetical protein
MIHFLVDALLGLAFALCARERLRADGPWSQPAITLVGLYVAIVVVPRTLYLFLVHPDWSWLYLFDASRVPRLAVVSAVAVSASAVVGGYAGGARLIREGQLRIALGVLGGGAAVLLILLAVAGGRIGRSGTYEAFQQGAALPLGSAKLGYALAAISVGMFAAAALVARELRRDGRRAAAR